MEETLEQVNNAVPIDGFNSTVLLILFGVFIFILLLVFFILSAIEKARIKKFSKPKKIYFKQTYLTGIMSELFKNKIVKKIIRGVSNKFSIINSDSTYSNDMKALMLILTTIIFGFVAFMFMVYIFGSKLWYLYIMYVIIIVLVVYLLLKFYADSKEIKMSKQLPEALNDLKIAYDNRKRLKLAIQDSYQSMPKEIRKEFAKLAESDNLEQSIEELEERVRNTWFRVVLALMLLAIKKGDREGALSEQLQMLNGVVSQEILIKESSRLTIQLYKIFIVCSPVLAVMMKNVISGMNEEIAIYYTTVASTNMLSLVIISAIALYFFLDMLENL